MKIIANAKINLTLDITGRRDDGFHTLRSVMVPVSLSDELIIEKSDSFSFKCNIPDLCGEDNLCVRAARLFFEASSVKPECSIELIKNIPFPAGLGGGSADAAAVLKGLNKLYSEPLDQKELFVLGARLGSDIPFCLLNKAALCEGRGELLTELFGLNPLNIVITIGRGRLSTAEVYKRYDSLGLASRNDTDPFLNALNMGDTVQMIKSVGNAFEPVADILCEETKLMRESLISLGALNARLSGSGPSVFGVFADEAAADKAATVMKEKGFYAVACVTV